MDCWNGFEAPPNQGSASYDFSCWARSGRSQLLPGQLSRQKRTSPSTIVMANTEMEYDPLGRAVRSADFLKRNSYAVYEPFCVGNTTLSPRGVQTSSSFDTLCRLVQVETQEERHLFGYDELDRMTIARVGELYAHEFGPDRVGAHYAKSFYKHDTVYTFDSLDRVTKVTYANGEFVAYQYDPEGNVLQMTDVHGHVTQYTYFNDGRLQKVVYQGQTFTYAYDAAGRLDSITYPSGGLVASFTTSTGASGWDANGQLLSLRYLKSGVDLHRFEYTYDDSGNRITLVDTPDSGGATSWSYGYDYLNRLTSVTSAGSTTLYTYDESDNRMSLTLPSGDQWTYGFDLADQITSKSLTPSGGSESLVESYVHDSDGNMIARTQGGVTTTYDWNTMNRLRQVQVGSAVTQTTSYDHGGIRRLKKEGSGSSKSFSSGSMSLCDTRPSGAVSFVQGHQLLGLEQGGNLYYLITDGLSSVRKVVNSSGVSEAEFKFDEFGVPETSTSPPADLSAHSYVGGLGQRNEGGGLYYARQRWYDANLGRWLSADPIGFAGGLNLYGYGNQNPINAVDPNGLVAGADDAAEIWLVRMAPWILEKFTEISTSCATRTTTARVASTGFRGSMMDFLPAWALPVIAGGGGTGVGIYFGMNSAGANGPPSGPIILPGFSTGQIMIRGYYPQGAPPIFRRNVIPTSELTGRPSYRGGAPIGSDGRPIELHHVGQSPNLVDEYTFENHRRGENYSLNHSNTGQCPSRINRREFKAQKYFIYVVDLKEGRFDGLP